MLRQRQSPDGAGRWLASGVASPKYPSSPTLIMWLGSTQLRKVDISSTQAVSTEVREGPGQAGHLRRSSRESRCRQRGQLFKACKTVVHGRKAMWDMDARTFISRTPAVALLSPCNRLLSPCCSPAVALQSPCCRPAVALLSPCRGPASIRKRQTKPPAPTWAH